MDIYNAIMRLQCGIAFGMFMQPLNLTETLEDQLQNRIYADQISSVPKEELETMMLMLIKQNRMYQRAIAGLMKGGISG